MAMDIKMDNFQLGVIITLAITYANLGFVIEPKSSCMLSLNAF